MKRLLMVAFHFPPQHGSSGIQRTLRLVRDLPSHGWQPIVLTATARSYEQVSNDLAGEVPADVVVLRAPALDAARHLAIAGRYPDFLARPDRWISWLPGAVLLGRAAIRRHRVDAIWSTYPIATAHLIGTSLSRRTGLPLIADFRDPMAQEEYPKDPKTRAQFSRIERDTIAQSSLSLFTTRGAAGEYRSRYPQFADRIGVLENGYDESSFANARSSGPIHPGKLTLLHSGVIYPKERDPRWLFQALGHLKRHHPAEFSRLVVRFRAPVHDSLLRELATREGVAAAVEILPAVSYSSALTEMMSADGLLVMQSASCNQQVPAKLYEYLRAGRPIMALTDPAGDTGTIVRDAGLDTIVPLDRVDSILALIRRFLSGQDPLPLPDSAYVAAVSRSGRAAELAPLLDRIAA
jgi:glycosyltransferase involved in cell wall biosynthesis